MNASTGKSPLPVWAVCLIYSATIAVLTIGTHFLPHWLKFTLELTLLVVIFGFIGWARIKAKRRIERAKLMFRNR